MAGDNDLTLDQTISLLLNEAVASLRSMRQLLDQISGLIALRNNRDCETEVDGGESQESLELECQEVAQLTKRERQVLDHLMLGCPNRAIARLLGISERTVKNHLHSIFTKLDVSDRTSLVVKILHNS